MLVIILAASVTIYNANIGYYFMEQLNATTDKIARVNSLYLVILLISNLYIVKLAYNYFTFNKLFALQIVGGILGMTLLSISIYNSNQLLIFISLIIFIFSTSMYIPLAKMYAVNNNPENANTELRFITSSLSLGMIVGSIIGGLAYMSNPNLIFIIIIILLIVALAIHLKQIKYSKI